MNVRFGGVTGFPGGVHVNPIRPATVQPKVPAPSFGNNGGGDAFVPVARRPKMESLATERAMQARMDVFNYQAERFSVESGRKFMTTSLL